MKFLKVYSVVTNKTLKLKRGFCHCILHSLRGGPKRPMATTAELPILRLGLELASFLGFG